MKNPLTRTEIMGLAFLAVLIAGITGCAILVQDCSGGSLQRDPSPAQIEILDTVDVPVKTEKVSKKREAKAKDSKKESRRKKSAAGNSKNNSVERRDPFKDTVPKIP